MPGLRSVQKSTYITPVVAYRQDVAAADAVPPAATADAVEIVGDIRGGANNLFIYIRLNGAGMNITPTLWRIEGDDVYEVIHTGWGAAAVNTVYEVGELTAGSYVVTLAGVFAGNTADIFQQHTE